MVILVSGCRGVVLERPIDPSGTIIPNSPGPAYVWIGDSWAWDSQSQLYIYQAGRWAKPKKSQAAWVDGYWKKSRSGWRYVRGYWKRN